MKSRLTKNLVLFPVLVLLAAVVLSGCSKSSETIRSFSQLKEPGRILAVSDGTPEEVYVREDFPDAKIQAYTDMIAAYTEVKNGKADACIHSRREMEMAIKNGFTDVCLLDGTCYENTVAVGISRVSSIPGLKEKINTFLQELKDDGTLDDMYERWVIKDDQTMPAIPTPENPETTLFVATTGTIMPYSYYIGDELAGYDIELAKRFAAWLDADLAFKVYSFSGIIAAAQAGEVDCIMSNLYYTKEHEEAIDFSEPVFLEEVTAMVKDEGTGVSSLKAFLESVSFGFEKTFIRENRWKLLLGGTITTLLISVLSILFGTLLGFAVYMLCRNGNPVANTITRICVRLVQNMPVVVFLMILCYIVFGKVQISNTVVSVIGFTIIFGTTVYLMMKTGIGTVDKGQAEAAYALGFSDRRTFFLIMLPQAMPHMMPSFIEQITALIKATSVVGYIAVQDLTKIGDIIRSRTYEAFFPLIAITLIYFGLTAILTSVVRRLGRRFDAKQSRHRSLLKGVKTHDRD